MDKIWSSTTDSKVNAKLHDLTTPSSFSAGLVSFTATNVILAKGTTYFVVVQDDNETDSPTIARTQATAEDSGGFANWSIGNFRHRTPRSLPDWNNASLSGLIIRLTVNGTAWTNVVPDAPQNLAAERGDTRVTLTWVAPESDGGASITRYQYRYSTGSTVPGSTTWTPVPDSADPGNSTADETSVTVANLTNDTQYAFEVRAVNSVGGGTKAGPVTARPVRMAQDEVLSASMTVRTAARNPVFFGYDSANTRYPGSSMTDNTFTVGGTDYTIPEIYRTGSGLYVYLSPLPTTTEVAAWRIDIGSHPFNFSEAARLDSGRFLFDGSTNAGFTSTFIHAFVNNATLTVRIVDTATIVSPADAPQNLTAEVGNSQVTLTWAAPESDGGTEITGYQYRYATGSNVPDSTTWTPVPDGTDASGSTADERSVTVPSLTNETLYALEVRAVNSVGGGTKAGPITARPFRMARNDFHSASMTVKTAARNPVFFGYDSANTRYPGSSMTDNTFTVGGTDYTIPEIYRTGSGLYVYLSPLPTTTEVAAWRIDIGSHPFNFSEAARLDSGRFLFDGSTTAGFTSTFIHAFVNNAIFTVRIVDTTPATVPDAPQNLAAERGDTRVTLTWVAPESDGGTEITGYEYRYATGSTVPNGTTWTPVPDSADPGNSTADETSVTVANLTNDTQYAFEVRAVNSVGGGTKAGPVTARPVRMAQDEVLSASMTVRTAARNPVFFGYDSANTRYPGSSMTDNTFTVGGTDYTIPEIYRTGSGLYVYLSPLPTTTEVAAWRIDIGSHPFNFSEAARLDSGRFLFDGSTNAGFTSTFIHAFVNNATLTVRIVDTATIVSPADAPQNLTAEVGNGQVTLRWTAPASDGGSAIRKYEYRYSAGSTVSESAMWTDVPDSSDAGDSTADETTVTVPNLTNGTQYAFEVRAVNGAGGGTKSRRVVARPLRNACNASNFASRSRIWTGNLTVETITSGGNTIGYGFAGTVGDLDDKDFTIGVNTYEIDSVAVASAGTNDGDLDFSLSADLTSAEKGTLRLHVCDATYDFSAATLSNATDHTYVWADDLDWSSVDRRTLHLSVPATSLPGAPQNLTAEAGNSQVTLRWAAPASDGGGAITKYEYRYSTGSTVSESAMWTDVPDSSDTGDSAADETNVTITSLTNGTRYAFEVRVVNLYGRGTKTAVTATPRLSPSQLELLSATAWLSTVTLTYNQALNPSSVPDKAHFTLSVTPMPERFECQGSNTSPNTNCFSAVTVPGVSSVTVSGNSVVLTLDAPYPLRYSPTVGEWHVGMDVKYNRRSNTIQAPGGSPSVDNSCGRAQDPIERVGHWRLLGCFWTNGYSPSYTGTGVPVTRTSPTLSQLSGRRITDIEISDAGSDNQWTTDETVDITVSFGGTTAFANTHRPSVWTPGWCQRKETQRPHSTHAKYVIGVGTASLLFRCTIFNGPHTSLRLAPNSVHDASNTLKISGTVTEYSWSYNLLADVRHDAVVKHATALQGEAPTITGSPVVSESGTDGAWTAGETVEVMLTFSENIAVDTTGGTPSVGLSLGGTQARSATYLRGSGTTELDFGYTLTTTDGSHSSMLVPIDSLALNGGTIRSQANGANAALSHNGAAMGGSPGPRGEGDPFTARFGGMPQSHDGSSAFTFELHFSEAPETLSYTTVAGGLLDVTGATVNGARRLTAGSNLAWEVTVTPSQSGDIGIRLPARACTATNAVCAGGRALEQAVSATVRAIPFTASFSAVPAEHDGTAFEIRFHLSEEPAGLSFRTIQSALFDVTGGSIKKASRLRPGKNKGWTLKLDPSGLGDVTVRVKPTTACDAPPGVCTPDGRKLGGGLQVLIAGPAVLSVADAEVDEAEGALLDFVVTMSKPRFTATTVAYATSDGTATAGSDYTATSGRLTFAAGEISKTVPVTVHDDSHDEGAETMVLTLSDPSGAMLGDASATGTINNTDAMPRAWLVRFGRTVGAQVVDALTQRLDGGDASHVTVAGINLIGESGVEPETKDADPFGLPEWAKNAEREADAEELTADDLLLRSAFHLSSGAQEPGTGPAFTAWGRVSIGGFEATVDDVTMDGDVTTGLVGFDAEWERALAGIMFSQSKGDGAYRLDPAKGDDAGTVESALTGVYPYARIDLNAKVSAWALAGVGSGELTLHQEDEKAMPTDILLRMGAIGVKGQVLDGTGPSGVGLNVKSDAMWVGTKSADTSELAPTEGAVTRLRLIVQGERSFDASNGARFTPNAEVGLRHDGGDAETGTGVEIGAGLRYTIGAVTIEAQARTLIAHEASGYKEWGASAAIRVTPSPSGRGLTLSIAPAWGQTGSAAERLWSAHDARAFGADSEFEADSRLAIDAGYGFGLPGNRGVLTPYAGMTLGDAGTRTMRTGTRWQLGPDVVVGLEAARQTSDAGEAANDLMLRAALRF